MSIPVISPHDLAERKNGKTIEIIDVRTPMEFREVHLRAHAACRWIPLIRPQ